MTERTEQDEEEMKERISENWLDGILLADGSTDGETVCTIIHDLQDARARVRELEADRDTWKRGWEAINKDGNTLAHKYNALRDAVLVAYKSIERGCALYELTKIGEDLLHESEGGEQARYNLHRAGKCSQHNYRLGCLLGAGLLGTPNQWLYNAPRTTASAR